MTTKSKTLNDLHCKMAKDVGVLVAVNSDAHISVRNGRVSGVAIGSSWQATLKLSYLSLPEPEKPCRLSSLRGATFGTGQRAPLAVRPDDNAQKAHGNSGIAEKDLHASAPHFHHRGELVLYFARPKMCKKPAKVFRRTRSEAVATIIPVVDAPGATVPHADGISPQVGATTMWYFILVPMFLFLVSLFFSIAAVLGLDTALVTNVLLVFVGIFVGCMIFLPAFKRQWQVTGDTPKDSNEPQEQRAAARNIARQEDEPQGANEQSSVAASQTYRESDRGIQTSSGEKPPPLAATGRYHSPG